LRAMKIRLLLMGSIISILGAILLAARSFATSFIGLILVGVALFVTGLLWK
jgi:hypothetical protein